MNSTIRTIAKAQGNATASDAVVVSFDFKWYDALRSRSFSAVLRKRIPRSFCPRWLYFHINSPKSAICARAEILSLGEFALPEAMAAQAELHLAEEEIRAYMAGRPRIGIYRLGSILLAEPERTSEEIGEQMIYHPPQSFFRLSVGGKELLDEICGF